MSLTAAALDKRSRSELVPVGQLRVGVVHAPVAGVFFVSVDESGKPHGVTVDLGQELASALDVACTFEVFPNSGECTEALAQGLVDVAFMPVDEYRRSKVDFGNAYYLLRSTFLLAPGLGVRTLADYQTHGRRFVGIAGTTTLRAAIRQFGEARSLDARSVEDALAVFSAGQADAVALSEDYLKAVQPDHPGSTVMKEAFQQTSISIAVGKGKKSALSVASAFVEAAKSNGMARRIFDRHGLDREPVAPAGT